MIVSGRQVMTLAVLIVGLSKAGVGDSLVAKLPMGFGTRRFRSRVPDDPYKEAVDHHQ
jgi:hypothetical protein